MKIESLEAIVDASLPPRACAATVIYTPTLREALVIYYRSLVASDTYAQTLADSHIVNLAKELP